MKTKILFLLTVCFLSFGNIVNAAETLDEVIAVVNDDVVTKSELNQAVHVIKLQMQQQQTAMPSDAVLKKKVLDQIILKKIQLQMAKQAGISIPDKTLDTTISGIAKQNNITDHELYQRIHEEGLSVSDYRNELRDQITLQKLQQQEVISRLNVSPDEVTTFLNSNAWASNSANEFHIEDILIPVSDSPTPDELAQAKNKAETIVEKVNKGANFHSLAQTESGASDALKGGDLGWRSLAEIPSAFSDKVIHMKKNEVAGPIQSPNGFHVIHLVDLRGTQAQKKPDRKEIENLLLQRKFEEAVQNWVSKLRAQAYVNIEPVKA